jgi:hypothetical protein
MTLGTLTPDECNRYAKALDKIRRQLFSKHTPADYFIVRGSEQRLPAYAEHCWNAACGAYRVVHWGGLSYAVDCADSAGLCELSITHDQGNRFHFWLRAAKGHTLCSVSIGFHEVDEMPYSYVRSYRRSNVIPNYGGRHT